MSMSDIKSEKSRPVLCSLRVDLVEGDPQATFTVSLPTSIMSFEAVKVVVVSRFTDGGTNYKGRRPGTVGTLKSLEFPTGTPLNEDLAPKLLSDLGFTQEQITEGLAATGWME